MKRKIIVSVLSGFFGSALLLILLSATGIVGAALYKADRVNDANVARSDVARSDPSAPVAPASTKARLTYQGRLTNSSGAPLNSTVNMVFKLYNRTGLLLWTSATRSVTPVNGLFTVYLGDGADPILDYNALSQAASIGVTVGVDAEMSPRQALNTVVGQSDTDEGVVGSSRLGMGVVGSSISGRGVSGYSASGTGVTGFSEKDYGVSGYTFVFTRAGVLAQNAYALGTALEINGGGIKVRNAGVGTTTPMFIQQVVTGGGNVCATRDYATVVNNPIINGNPGAILIVTPNYGLVSGGVAPAAGPYGVLYDDTNSCGFGDDKWAIYLIQGAPALTNGSRINVLAVIP
jgi:hypothetical protein